MKLNKSIKRSMKQKPLKEAGEITEEQIEKLVEMFCDGTANDRYYVDYHDAEEILTDLNSNGDAWLTCNCTDAMYGYSEILLYKENNTLKMVISFKLTASENEAPYATLVATGYNEIKKMIKNLEKIYNEVALPWIEAVGTLVKQVKSGKYGRTESFGAA